jgi:hypothetical protein
MLRQRETKTVLATAFEIIGIPYVGTQKAQPAISVTPPSREVFIGGIRRERFKAIGELAKKALEGDGEALKKFRMYIIPDPLRIVNAFENHSAIHLATRQLFLGMLSDPAIRDALKEALMTKKTLINLEGVKQRVAAMKFPLERSYLKKPLTVDQSNDLRRN